MEKTGIWTGRWRKADFALQCVWTSSNPMKAGKEQKWQRKDLSAWLQKSRTSVFCPKCGTYNRVSRFSVLPTQTRTYIINPSGSQDFGLGLQFSTGSPGAQAFVRIRGLFTISKSSLPTASGIGFSTHLQGLIPHCLRNLRPLSKTRLVLFRILFF